MTREHFHFVTGRLAEHALRKEVAALSAQIGFEASIDVLPITVAALMTPAWIARHIQVPPQATKVILPGYCEGDIEPVCPHETGRRRATAAPGRTPAAALEGGADLRPG